MAVIRANRESIDDRFSVLGFTVRSELPLFEIAIATDPELLRPERRAQRTPGNFHTSRLLRTAPSQRGEAVYLVPPEVVSRFVGQQRLYFGLATYRESDRSTPVSMRMPDRGTMYVSLSGLTERGLRRSVRSRGPMSHGGAAYGGGGVELGWGGDAAGTPPPPSRDEDRAVAPKASTAPGAGGSTGYSDGYSDELWTQPAPAAAAPAPTPPAAPDPATAPSATAQGLARRNGVLRRPMVSARSLLISSDYQPANFWDALRAQAGFFLDSAMWYLGVLDTRVMPHSAVCQIRVPDGSTEGGLHGSGFFIGPRLIMTAAHVVNGQSELIVVRGKNGGGTAGANEPFGRFKVRTFRPHGSYGTHGSDFDIALIQVPAANAVGAGQYFDLVEELTQSRPEGVVVSGYAALWYANDLVEHFVNETIDPNRQHLMGGHIRELPTDETFSYNIQTLGGTSGSPVYWIEDTGAGPQAHLVGVHVAAHDATTNLGCRITANKLTWIRQVAAEWGQTLTFSMGRFARSLSAVDEDSAHDIGGPIPDDATSTAQGWHGTRGLNLPAPEYPMASRFEAAASGNFRAVSGTRSIDRIVIHITDGGASINGTISWFKNPAAKVSAHYVIGQDGEIVQMVAHKDVAWHAGSANGTSIGIEHVANTKGLNPTPAQMCASAALVTWLCDQFGITADRAHILGHAEADGKTTHQACPNAVWDWVYYMDMITTRTCYVPDALVPRTQSLALHRHGHSHGLGEPQETSHDGLTDPDAMGIDGDIPDGDSDAVSQAQAWYARALGDPAPEYPGALKFAPAHPNNYTLGRKAGTAIDRIVIHITASKNDYDKTVKNWFQNPKQMMGNKRVRVSAHYVIGRGGEVVQVVAHGDTAHHANGANSRSIGIEHNATTTRDHAPTDAQYRASAKLVAWLCAQLGLPADRTHVLGHSEVDPKTTHTSCPNSVWDWDTYMGHLATEAAALAGGAVAQGLGARRGYSMAQEIITPFYDPADPMSALTCQADAFSQAREEWFAGVPNTTLFPHSAICLLEMQDGAGKVGRGTGFYIGRNRILTCAHNLYNKTSVTIIPGKNGNGGGSTEPFGRTTLTSASWRIPASYAGSNKATDLAVIDNVPIDAPNGQWFDSLEELNQSRPEGVVVCGYSSRSEKVPELTKAIDGFKQHLHAGYIAALADDDSTFSYPILTLKRASGSPVYYISDKSGVLSSYVVGVHTGADTDDLNRGCRLMQNKIDWIEGRTTSLSLGAPGRMGSRALGDAFSVHWTDTPMTYQSGPMACWAAAASMVVGWRDQQSIPDTVIAEKVGVFDAFNKGLYGRQRGYVADAWNLMAEAPASYTIEAWRDMLAANGPLYIDQALSIGDGGGSGGHVRVLVGMTSGGAADGSDTTMYMHDPARGPIKLSFADFLTFYEDRTRSTGGYLEFQIMHSGGVAGRSPASASAFSLGASHARSLAHGRALGNDGPSDIPVHLIPQPNKDACWAASMAMLLAHRRQQSHTPESIVNEVGGSLASSYGWDLLKAVRDRYGFVVIDQPSNASIYHSPRQWAEWLNAHGPLWVVIVGAPHAVVVAGIRGDLDDANAAQVKILNPWDTRIAFDNDPIEFRPPNHGYEDWLPFADFAADFGNMSQPDYGNWRILHLPASAVSAQSLSVRGNGGLRLASPPRSVRALNLDATGARREPIEPSRVLGVRMSRVIGEAGGSRWALDQLEGLKSPSMLSPSVSSAAPTDVRIDINDWPAIDGAPTPLPLKIEFRAANGSLGDVRITAGLPANLAYGVEVVAKIEDGADADGVARLRVRIDYRFRGLSQGNADAVIELTLRGDGRYERENGWRDANAEKPDVDRYAALSPA
ncbi:MAG: N-acetylmuramoyl-L-alanine amidase [Hydrogenophaga sp.]|uniref:N-acetylmuramoyl-L-alanine amidase n=2 Tax=Hydrogenophaga sp. TaxID=1904254 RepID=UPI0025B83F2C|nr:N-acetylmuramoyl-L-alanine amidase [Hydrogenophaga sp.]MBT9553525.1 N-acetylmuramoyl-L-alanine amidase [Hydrogenophaga sp.]